MAENGDGLAGGEGAWAFECPGCGEVVGVVAGTEGREVECPACGGVFGVPGEVGDEDAGGGRADELDALRMRHVIVQRRAATRSRTYALLGAGVCAMGVAKLGQMTYREVGWWGWGWWQVAYVGVAAAAAWGAWYFLGRAAYWGRESRAGKMPEPEVAPDFSTLGDGSQRARDLEDIR